MLYLILGLGFSGLIFFVLWMSKSMKDSLHSLSLELMEKNNRNFMQLAQTEKDSFQSLSFEVMEKNNRNFMQLAQTEFEKQQAKAQSEWDKKEKNFESLLTPLKESMQEIDKQNRLLEKRREGAYSSLEEQVKSLVESERRLGTETGQLVRALKSPNIRGSWGEITLRRVVELSGMLNHCDFFEQEEVKKDGRSFRPDLVVRLPGERQIVVDAKTPICAYMEAQEAGNEDVREKKLKEHAEHLRTHIKALSRKEYWKQFDRSPEYVILFLPAEAFYSSALQMNPSLLEMGARDKIIIANPVTLISILKTTHLVWNEEKLSENAKEISEIGRELYERMMKMGEHFSQLGRHINQTVDSYNHAVASFESRILASARKLKKKGAAFGEDLPGMVEVEKKTKRLKVLESTPELESHSIE